jgi:inner membrane protein
MQTPSTLDRFNSWARNSVSLKLVAIGFLILILIIPSTMIDTLIYERMNLRDEATEEVSSKWGGRQALGGPVLTIPYYTYVKNDKGQTETQLAYAHFLPDNLQIEGQLSPEKRYRGIYVVVLYNAKLKVKGRFDALNFDALPLGKESLRLQDAFLSFQVTDMKGIRENIKASIGGKDYNFEPGISSPDIFESGISIPFPITDNPIGEFAFTIDLNGSSEINFLPFGKETQVSLSSNWGNPSFDGAFLPDNRSVTEQGFTAQWRVLQLNRNYPQQGIGNFIGNASSFGVKLKLPVDEYQRTTRSAKYCIMFIILTFLTFFFVEILNKKRIHAIQYLLVGFAITLFYILLLSMSEHISFDLSYWVAAGIILLMVTFYAKSNFQSNFLTGLTFSILGILYAFFYSLLQLQDYALLMGSFGLLFILAIIMYLTRKIDWYAFSTDDSTKE